MGKFLDYKKFLTEKDFMLLTPISSNTTKVLIQCKHGHQYRISPSAINIRFKQNLNICKFCDKLEKQTKELESLRDLAKQNKGELLSQVYVNNSNLMSWKCQIDDHSSWEAPAERIKRGGWCKKCAYDKGHLKYSIEDLQNIAASRGGNIIDTTYKGVINNHQWQCKYKHSWYATPTNIMSGSWCPYCSSGLYEEICRGHFEQLFDKKFPKSYPKWLKSEKGQLELDGFCEELQLAFEHQGDQHYNHNDYLKISKEASERIKEYKLKVDLCNNQKLKLIVIPQLVLYTKIRDLKDFILNKCECLGIQITSAQKNLKIDWSNCYINSNQQKYDELRNLAKTKNGLLLSSKYSGSTTPHHWYCNVHKESWWSSVASIKNKHTWCPECSLDSKRNISLIKEIETDFNGCCTSVEEASFKYKNNKQKIKWRCLNKPHPLITASCRNIVKRQFLCHHCHKEAKHQIKSDYNNLIIS